MRSLGFISLVCFSKDFCLDDMASAAVCDESWGSDRSWEATLISFWVSQEEMIVSGS